MKLRTTAQLWGAICLALWLAAPLAQAQSRDETLAPYLGDRGPGLPTSLFGTYVRRGELLVYSFYEYERNNAEEYHPSELGVPGETDYFGSLVSHEIDLFVGYGLTDRLALEFEGQLYTKADFKKAPNDPTAVPARLSESGLGEIEGQLRYRWAAETERRPELFSFAEVVFPLQRDKLLIGASDWVGALGFGAIKGWSWGTLTARASLSYEEGGLQAGEYALEYLKRINPRWAVVCALEGAGEDLSAIGEVQWFFSPHARLKLNSGFGLSQKVPDFAPEIGIMLSY